MAGLQSNFMYSTQNGGNPMNPGDWNWKNPNTYISMTMAGLGASGLVNFNVPGALPNGALQAGIQVTTNGLGNLAEGNNFFDNWYWAAGMGFLNGSLTGYIMADEIGLNRLTGGGYQKVLDNAVSKEGFSLPKTKWLVANNKNAKLVSETFEDNVKISGNTIKDSNYKYKQGVNFGREDKGNITLITRKTIRNTGYFSLTDVIRHENVHQYQVLRGSKLEPNQREIEALMINFINPATNTTQQKAASKMLEYGFDVYGFLRLLQNLRIF